MTLDPQAIGWLLQSWLIGSFIYWRQQSIAQEEGAGLQGESSRWKEAFWLSWSHGKQLSGGARELVPGSVCRKGLSYRDQQLDRYVSQESHYPLPFLTLPPFFYYSCSFAHNLGLGGMTNSHSVGPQVDSSNLWWAGARYPVIHNPLTNYYQVIFITLCGKTDICPSFPGFFCWFPSPPRNQILSILVVPSF